MLDLLIAGGRVVDGTGAPARMADIGVRDGRIVALGSVDEPAARTIDATGLVVTPGFIDIHTHYDAQILWDPSVSPSPLHGVTTVLGGNCGFTIAPMAPQHVDYVMRMMAEVEGMPLDTLRNGPEWNWRTFGEWLDRLDGHLAVNAGFMVGHSTLRRVAMGEAAVEEAATDDQVAAMVAMAHEAMAAGALGFSSSLGPHTDGDGRPVPSRAAGREEFLALAGAVRDHAGTSLEFIPGMGEIAQDRIELMTDMSLAANRSLNWNLLGSLSPTAVFEQQLTSCDWAADHGAHVVALTLPDVMRMRAGNVLETWPGWKEVLDLPEDERRRAVQDPALRQRLRDSAGQATDRALGALAQWDAMEIAEVERAEDAPLVGRTIAALAAERGVDPLDLVLDLVVPGRLPLTLVFPSLVPELGTSDEGWRVRAAVWQDPRVVLGGSDAGAHLSLMCHANYTTVVLGTAVRERGLLTFEQAVRLLTDVPARLYGLRERGRIAEGWHADLVVLDPERVGSDPARARYDLPGGGCRLYAESRGIEHVLAGGHEVVRADSLTGELGGTLLRSGVHTDTVTVPGGGSGRRS